MGMSETREEKCPGCGGILRLARTFWCSRCDFTRPELARVCECPVCQEFYHLEFHPDGSCPSCGAFGVKSKGPVCSICGEKVEEVEALLCPSCGRYFPRAARAAEEASRSWTSELGVKSAGVCEVCGEEDPKQLGVHRTRFTLNGSGKYWETERTMCKECGDVIRFGETVTIGDIRAVKLKGKWEKGDGIMKRVKGIHRCVACHELDQRKVGVYETIFLLNDHPEAWGSEVVICKGCYDDIRAEMPGLFAKAKRVKARLRSRTPRRVRRLPTQAQFGIGGDLDAEKGNGDRGPQKVACGSVLRFCYSI